MAVQNILFLDIETVSAYPGYQDLPSAWKEVWDKKAEYLIRDKQQDSPSSIYGRSAIYAEFGKIICISCGILSGRPEERRFLIKSFYGDDERLILQQFSEMLQKWSDGSKSLCAHNGKEFDFPFLCRRLIIQGLPLPDILNTSGKKPWELPFLDTMDLWKFGEYKNFTSLNLLALTLGIPTPKDDIDGSMVGETYWIQHDLPRIVTYCQKDVITVAQVYLRLQGMTLVRPDQIDFK